MTTAAITTLRSTIAAALANDSVWSTFSFPPSTIVANSVVVAPADPYLRLAIISKRLYRLWLILRLL
jgi:hypothetical protein